MIGRGTPTMHDSPVRLSQALLQQPRASAPFARPRTIEPPERRPGWENRWMPGDMEFEPKTSIQDAPGLVGGRVGLLEPNTPVRDGHGADEGGEEVWEGLIGIEAGPGEPVEFDGKSAVQHGSGARESGEELWVGMVDEGSGEGGRVEEFTPKTTIQDDAATIDNREELWEQYRHSFPPDRPISLSTPAEIRRSWAICVDDFSRKMNADRLAALVAFIQHLKLDEPLLGLWKADLAEGLLWERGVWDEPAARKRVTPFPSWSWMSLPGPAQYPSFVLSAREIELLEARISWADQPLVSSLRTAELVLRAKVLRGTLTYRGRESPESSLYLDMGANSKVGLFERIDIPDSYYDGTTVHCILVGATALHWFFVISSVVNPERNPYVRIGRAYSPVSSFGKIQKHLDTMERQELVLR